MRRSDKNIIAFLRNLHFGLKRREEIGNKMADWLGYPVENLLYHYDIRDIEQVGKLKEGWEYAFHGRDCSVWNTHFTEYHRLEFGAGGRLDCFGYGNIFWKKEDLGFYPHNATAILFNRCLRHELVELCNKPLFELVISKRDDRKEKIEDYFKSLPKERQSDTDDKFCLTNRAKELINVS